MIPAALALILAVAPKPLVVAFGDSTTAPRLGVARVYPERLEALLAETKVPAEVVNAGVKGDTTRDASLRFQRDVLSLRPAVVIIQFGLNDAAVDLQKGSSRPRVPLEVYREQLATFVRDARLAGIRPILMTPNPMFWTPALERKYGKPPYDKNERWGLNALVKDYAEAVRDLAVKQTVPLVDVYRLFEKRDAQRGDADKWTLDGMHPTDAAHAAIANELAPLVRNRLSARGTGANAFEFSSRTWNE